MTWSRSGWRRPFKLVQPGVVSSTWRLVRMTDGLELKVKVPPPDIEDWYEALPCPRCSEPVSVHSTPPRDVDVMTLLCRDGISTEAKTPFLAPPTPTPGRGGLDMRAATEALKRSYLEAEQAVLRRLPREFVVDRDEPTIPATGSRWRDTRPRLSGLDTFTVLGRGGGMIRVRLEVSDMHPWYGLLDPRDFGTRYLPVVERPGKP